MDSSGVERALGLIEQAVFELRRCLGEEPPRQGGGANLFDEFLGPVVPMGAGAAPAPTAGGGPDPRSAKVET
jgi:hypothetical protein